MTGHRAAAPVSTEVMSVNREWLLTCGDPAGLGHTVADPAGLGQARVAHPAPPALGDLAAQTSAACALRPDAESVKCGRDFVCATLRAWGLAALADMAGLVVSELVTNALRHGMPAGQRFLSDRPIRLRLLGQRPYVMCMVTDPGHGIPTVRESGPFAESGRGLNVVESCCVRWGWHLLDGGGKVVWALMHPDA